MKERCWENLFSLETIYYVLFLSMLLVFIYGGKICTDMPMDENGLVLSAERKMKIDSGLDSLTLKEQYCDNRNAITLYGGSIFIALAVFRGFYKKASKRKRD